MVFKNGVKNIQAAAYNGARTVSTFWEILIALILCYWAATYKVVYHVVYVSSYIFSDQRSFQVVPSSSDDIVEFPYNLGKSLFEERTLSQQSSCRWCYTIHPCLTKFSSIGGKQRVPNEISSCFDYFLWQFFSLTILVR